MILKNRYKPKKEMVKRVLAPIRIKVDNRRDMNIVKAQKIINDYSQGSTKNHLQNDAGGKVKKVLVVSGMI